MKFLRILAVAGFLVAVVCGVAKADDSRMAVFAGGQLDFSNYVFGGVTVALPGSTIGNGVAVRGLVDAGGYSYVSSDLGTVKANFGGGEIDGVYQITHGSFWADGALGVNDTYTGLSPYDPNNRLRGQQVELRVSLDGGKISGPWRLDWFGYYGPRLSDYEAMVGGTHALSSIWRLGLQVYSEGNPTYSLYQVGPYAALTFGRREEFQLSAGQAWESGLAPRAYVKALLYQRL